MTVFREYAFGQPVILQATFATTEGVRTNPSTVAFKTGLVLVNPPPDPTAVDAVFGVDGAVTNPSVGVFNYTLTPATAGNYIARVVGTGTVQGAQVTYFRVLPNPFA